jgi:hypothetical protein
MIGGFQGPALLRIHCGRFRGRDGEKGSIEGRYVPLEKMSAARWKLHSLSQQICLDPDNVENTQAVTYHAVGTGGIW